MQIALVHDWLTGMRGGEKVLSLLCGLFPSADLFTLIHTPGSCDCRIEAMRIRTSWLDRLPGIQRYYRYLLPVMPAAIESFDLSDYDLVISCSHCVAKGARCDPAAAHVCYCFTPMRYAWSQANAYRFSMGLSGLFLRLMAPYLQAWDKRTARRVDRYVANSHNVAERIRTTYRRQADVLYSPVDLDFLTPAPDRREDFFLMVTALAPYKRVDQAIQAFAALGRPLRIIGSGQMLNELRSACPPNVEMLGWQDDRIVRDHYRRCRAVVFPGEEDFGMVPVEAMACGAPVIAYGAGGALETVQDIRNPGDVPGTGLLYTPQTTDALAEAVLEFDNWEGRFEPSELVRWARRFSPGAFLQGFRDIIDSVIGEKGLATPW